jgi:hypothetical protein
MEYLRNRHLLTCLWIVVINVLVYGLVTLSLFFLIPIPLFFCRVRPLKKVSSSCVYSQCAVHIVVGPYAKGHFIHAGSLGPEFFFFFFFFYYNWCCFCPHQEKKVPFP